MTASTLSRGTTPIRVRPVTASGGRRLVVVSGSVLALMLLLSLIAPLLPLPDPQTQDLTARLIPPVWESGD